MHFVDKPIKEPTLRLDYRHCWQKQVYLVKNCEFNNSIFTEFEYIIKIYQLICKMAIFAT